MLVVVVEVVAVVVVVLVVVVVVVVVALAVISLFVYDSLSFYLCSYFLPRTPTNISGPALKRYLEMAKKNNFSAAMKDMVSTSARGRAMPKSVGTYKIGSLYSSNHFTIKAYTISKYDFSDDQLLLF